MSSDLTLANGESIIRKVSGKSKRRKSVITLTNKRVYQETFASGYKELQVIPLSKVDSYGIGTTHYRLLLLLGILLIAVYGLGLILILIWWLTKKTTFDIVSGSGVTILSMDIASLNRDSLFSFLQEVGNNLTDSPHG